MPVRKRGVLAAIILALTPALPATAEQVEELARITLDPARFDAAFGGISGIDYDPRRRRWVLLSDDRSDHAPARFYTVRIAHDAKGWRIGKARRTTLRDAAGAPFPPAGTGREAVDPEAIRVEHGTLLWTSEGDVRDGYGPALLRSDRRGRMVARFPLPANLRLDPTARHGIRDNGTLEGLTLAPDGASNDAPDGALWLAMEAPLIEDGEPARDGNAPLVRFTRMGKGTTRQYAYRLDAVPPAQHGKAADNGVTEILALDAHRMLVLERSGAPTGDGRFVFHCRLYLADFTAAQDVAQVDSLKTTRVSEATKQLLLDFDTLPGENPGNLEGMAFWPDGTRSRLLLVNDNNFTPGEPTRLLLLSLPPALTSAAPPQ